MQFILREISPQFWSGALNNFLISFVPGDGSNICERKDHSGNLGGNGLSHGEPSYSQRSKTGEHPGGQAFPYKSMKLSPKKHPFVKVVQYTHPFK